MIQQRIQEALAEVLRQLSLPEDTEVQLSMPRDPSHGDFSSNIAMKLAKTAGIAPRKLAESIAQALNARGDLGAQVSLAGPGFLNFKVDGAPVAQALKDLLRARLDFSNESGKGTRIQVEFVSANPTGPLNVVNARAAAYGSTLAALLRTCGYEVESEFYVNDTGRQVELLGESLRARWLEHRGEEVTFPEDGYHGAYVGDMVKHLPPKELAAWQQLPSAAMSKAFGAWAVERLLESQKADLQRFGVQFDRWFCESELHAQGEVLETFEALHAANQVYEQDGAWFFRSMQWDDDKDRVVKRSDGTPTYFLADAAYHRNKRQRGFGQVIDVWGPDHHGHIVRMQAVCRALAFPENWLEVVIVQWVKLLEDGQAIKMSKRAGQLVTLAELVEAVGPDVARYFFLMRQQNSHLDFDMTLARTEGDENPVHYVKYAHARICSVICKANAADMHLRADDAPDNPAVPGDVLPEDCALERLQEAAERNLVRQLLDWPGFLKRAAEAREPHRLTSYSEDLARAFHKFYHDCRIIQDDRELGMARLALCHATRRVLASALGLMSIEAPSSM